MFIKNRKDRLSFYCKIRIKTTIHPVIAKKVLSIHGTKKHPRRRKMTVCEPSQQPEHVSGSAQAGKPHREDAAKPEVQKLAEETARAASGSSLGPQFPTPSTPRAARSARLPETDQVPTLGPLQALKTVKEGKVKEEPTSAEGPTKDEVRAFLEKVETWLQDSSLKTEGEILFCTLALTCTDPEALLDLKKKAQELVIKGMLPPTVLNIGGSKDAGKEYFRNMIAKFREGYKRGVNAPFLKQMEDFQNDPTGKALLLKHPQMATEFKALLQETRKQELERLKRVGDELNLGKKAQTSELSRLGFALGERSEKSLKRFAADIAAFAQTCQDPIQLEELNQVLTSLRANRWAKAGTILGTILDEPQKMIDERRKVVSAKPQTPMGLVLEVRDLVALSHIKPNEKISLDDAGRPIVIKQEILSRAFGLKPNPKSIAGVQIVLGTFKEAARSCSPEDLPLVIEAFNRFSQSPWLDTVCAQDESVREQYNQLVPYMNPAGCVMFRNPVLNPMPGVRSISMPALEEFADAGLFAAPPSPKERKRINLCDHVPFSDAIGSLTEKLTRGQPDISFHASCRGQAKEDRHKLDDKQRVYDPKNPQPQTVTKPDPIAGVVVSTAVSYPVLQGRNQRYGDPAADDAQYVRIPTDQPGTSVVVYSGADGSGHSLAARNAAKAANAGFVEYCQDAVLKADSLSLNRITRIALEGVAKAQETIVADKGSDDREKMTGLTTHCGIVYVQNARGPSYAVAALTGDMKVFIRDKDGHVREITEGNRGGVDPTDPGGQLGGALGKDIDLPDIRNLSAYVLELQPGDELLPMSDGVHDNLDPSELGLTPEEAYDEIMKSGSDEQKAALRQISREEMQAATQEWRRQREIFGEGNPPTDQGGNPLPLDRQGPWRDTPTFGKLRNIYMQFKVEQIGKENPGVPLSDALTSYTMEVTKDLRKYTETGMAPIPWLYGDEKTRKQFSGKLDHISCGQLGMPAQTR